MVLMQIITILLCNHQSCNDVSLASVTNEISIFYLLMNYVQLFLQILEVRNGKETRMDLMVMENLLYGRHLSRTYDLKGAIFARHVAGSDSCTFLDQNFIEDMRECPIYLSQRTKKLFERAIWNDTSFLTVCIMHQFGTDPLIYFINLIFSLNIQVKCRPDVFHV